MSQAHRKLHLDSFRFDCIVTRELRLTAALLSSLEISQLLRLSGQGSECLVISLSTECPIDPLGILSFFWVAQSDSG